MSNSYKFSDGSTIEWVDMETIRYSREGRSICLWVDYEEGFFSRGRVLRLSSIMEWESTGSKNLVTDEEKAEIITKVIEYYESQNRKCRIQND